MTSSIKIMKLQRYDNFNIISEKQERLIFSLEVLALIFLGSFMESGVIQCRAIYPPIIF